MASRHPRFRPVGVENYLLPGSTQRHDLGLGLHVIVVHSGPLRTAAPTPRIGPDAAANDQHTDRSRRNLL
jgi:hypothetical protein